MCPENIRSRFWLPLFALLALNLCEERSIASSPITPLGEAYLQLENQARKTAPSLILAREESRQKSAARWTAWTQWLPRLDLQLSQSQSIDYSFVTSGAFGGLPFSFEPEKVNRSRWNLIASLPLYRRSVHLGVQAAHTERERSQIRLAVAEGEFDSKLLSAFGQLMAEEHALVALTLSLEAAKKNLTEARLRFELGQKTKIDVLRAEAELSSLESRILTTRERRESTANRLAELTGVERSDITPLGVLDSKPLTAVELRGREESLRLGIEKLTTIESALSTLEPYLHSEDEAAALQAIDRRLGGEILRSQAIHADEDRAKIVAEGTVASEWPELTLQASLNKQAGAWDEAISPSDRSYSVLLNLTIPVFSFGSSISRIQEDLAQREAASTQATASARELRNSLILDRSRILMLIQAEKAQRLAIRQNEELAELSFRSYQLGRASILELLTAQNAAMEARTQWVRTRVDLASLVSNFTWTLLGQPVPHSLNVASSEMTEKETP